MTMRHRLSLALTLAVCAILLGCAGATRLPVRDRGPGGEPLKKDELDLSFLDSPTVSRDDVVTKLTRIDTGVHDPHLFWGRWAESKWGYWWFVAAQGGGAGDARRLWHVRNLLVTFDDNGALQSKQLIADDHLLWRHLHEAIVRASSPDRSEPEVLALTGNARSMTLGPDGLEILEKKGRFLIVPDKIVRFSHAGSGDQRNSARITCHTIHFSEKTPVGRKITFCDTNEHLPGVFQYLNQRAPKSMQWE